MNSREFEELSAGLEALKAASRDEQPPARLQELLLDEFRRRRSAAAPVWRRWTAACAVAAVAGIATLLLDTRPAPPPQPRAEVTTGFFPLAGDANRSLDGAAVIRMTLPRRVLVNFGLPMNPDRAAEPVKADIAIGPDGTARAVRFVM